jgi:integrase
LPAIWTIPGTRTKNKIEHIVHLSPLAVEIIRERMKASNHDLLFTNHGRDEYQRLLESQGEAKQGHGWQNQMEIRPDHYRVIVDTLRSAAA